MYSPEQINSMTDEEARKEFTRLNVEYYGEKWRPKFSRDTGVGQKTAYLWGHNKRPPVWAFTMLQNALERRLFVSTFLGLNEATKIAQKLNLS